MIDIIKDFFVSYETHEKQRMFKFWQISPGYLKYLIWEICYPAVVARPDHDPYVAINRHHIIDTLMVSASLNHS